MRLVLIVHPLFYGEEQRPNWNFRCSHFYFRRNQYETRWAVTVHPFLEAEVETLLPATFTKDGNIHTVHKFSGFEVKHFDMKFWLFGYSKNQFHCVLNKQLKTSRLSDYRLIL